MTGSCVVVPSITHSYVKGVGLIDTDGKLELVRQRVPPLFLDAFLAAAAQLHRY